MIASGLAILFALIVWIGNFAVGHRTYQTRLCFENAAGIHAGTIVRLRGVHIGQVVDVSPQPQAVVVTADVMDRKTIIPKDSKVESNQSGLISETIIDITPLNASEFDRAVSNIAGDKSKVLDPLSKNCNSDLIACHTDMMLGVSGTSYDGLVRETTALVSAVNQFAKRENIPQDYKAVMSAMKKLDILSVEATDFLRSSKSIMKQLSSSSESLQNTLSKADKSMQDGEKKTLAQTIENIGKISENLSKITSDIVPLLSDFASGR